KEVAATVPVLDLVHIHQPEVGLVDQRRGLESLAEVLLGDLLGGQLPQLVVHQGQELFGALGVAILDGGQDAGNFSHRRLSPFCASTYLTASYQPCRWPSNEN